MADIHPALRASLDRELEEAVQGLLRKAAEHDGKDVIEANVDLMNDLLASELSVPAIAAAASALAIRLHRGLP